MLLKFFHIPAVDGQAAAHDVNRFAEVRRSVRYDSVNQPTRKLEESVPIVFASIATRAICLKSHIWLSWPMRGSSAFRWQMPPQAVALLLGVGSSEPCSHRH